MSIVAVCALVGATAPAGVAHAAGEDDPLAPWSFQVSVDWVRTESSLNHHRQATFADADDGSMDFRWTASDTFRYTPGCPSNDQSWALSGEGVGAFTVGAVGFPGEWDGLPAANTVFPDAEPGDYTSLIPNGMSNLVGQYTVEECGGTEPIMGSVEQPVLTENFLLVGTVDDLVAAPTGTRFTYEYSKTDATTTTTVTISAFKGASDRDGDGVVDEADYCPDVPGSIALTGCPGFSVEAQHAYLGLATGMTGGESATVRPLTPVGDLSWLGEVCIVETWSATVKHPRSTLPVLWNGDILEDLSGVDGSRTQPTRLVGPKEVPRFPKGIYIENIKLKSCSTDLFAFRTTSIFSVAALSGELIGVNHGTTVTVARGDGLVVATVPLPSSSAGPDLVVEWLQRDLVEFG
ncbi:hypothetical protein E8D34_13410 [Nocardioides sp. GY 10113]|uniref:hypothetical protein n=1 Tax=Nocardioides sp. GY 10113 TaxID=2569761 RepID=UPI0010A7E8A8|nr:hypothetical protein [Nocardioides sp. GY 10113]TIC85067.1 hypothetical protein E8D34_13410 [Nocardioides sp. GY 10113]